MGMVEAWAERLSNECWAEMQAKGLDGRVQPLTAAIVRAQGGCVGGEQRAVERLLAALDSEGGA
jgi:hypothetical protein